MMLGFTRCLPMIHAIFTAWDIPSQFVHNEGYCSARCVIFGHMYRSDPMTLSSYAVPDNVRFFNVSAKDFYIT